jgi:putative membrane protein
MTLANASRLPLVLLALYLVEFTVLAFNPVDRPTWLVENATVWIIVGLIAVLYVRGVRFSNLAYGLMAVLVFLHTIGGHWTFAEVPFGWVTRLFGLERDNFDRVAHFSVGFYAFPIAEWLWAKRLVRNRFLLATYPVFAIGSVAMGYELFEWMYAALAAPEAGAAYLGSQGDIWDAQKDMLSDTLGAILATAIFFARHGAGRLRADLAETSDRTRSAR